MKKLLTIIGVLAFMLFVCAVDSIVEAIITAGLYWPVMIVTLVIVAFLFLQEFGTFERSRR